VKKQEYDKLVGMGLIPAQIAKYWYWSAMNEKEDIIIDLLLRQSVELEPSVKAQLEQKNLHKFIE
jgi:hypothetical protein